MIREKKAYGLKRQRGADVKYEPGRYVPVLLIFSWVDFLIYSNNYLKDYYYTQKKNKKIVVSCLT